MRPKNVERRFETPGRPPRGVERRKRAELRVNLGRHMAHGWLAFWSGIERRRLAPIPLDWQDLAEDQLAQLCDRALPVSHASDHLAP